MDDDAIQREIEELLNKIEELLGEVRQRVTIKPKGEESGGQ